MNGVPERLKAALADRYEIEREIGSGGMATVYLAEDLRYHRQVAVKVLKPELAHAVGADRFLAEIQITAQLNHPHILPLLDSGEADGFLYFVMPYVAGESLRARLDREGKLPIDEALRIAEQVASALEHAHSHEVIHRDVKPENILLHEGEAMVADFGIAVAVSVAGGERVTETGIAVGTPAFMSPEQASGEKGIDERSDIYSLGCVLYEMLGGATPHSGATPQEILAKKVLGEARSIRELRPEADEALDAVLSRALEAVPEDRFATAAEFGKALRSPDVGWTLAARRLAAKRRKLVAATAAAFVVLVLAVGAVLQYVGGIEFLFRPAAAGFVDPHDCIVVTEFENETEDAALGLSVRTLVVTDIGQTPYVGVLGDEQLRGTLELMRLPDSTRVDQHLALEIAQRENCPAVVAGTVAPLGTGYLLSARILNAATREEVVQLSEPAMNDSALYEPAQRLARQVRRHLGESLASIQRSEPLERVTTSSLEALKLYSRAVSADLLRGDRTAATALLEQAVALDTAFAIAYRKLRMTGEDWRTIELAYRFRERATEREQLQIVGDYHWLNWWLDSAVFYYEMGLELYPNPDRWSNNLALMYGQQFRYEDAVHLWLKKLETPATPGREWAYAEEMAKTARALGRHGLADSALSIMRETILPGQQHRLIQTAAWNAYYAGNLVLVDSLVREMEKDPRVAREGRRLRAGLAAMHGRMDEAFAVDGIDLAFINLASFAAGTPERALPYVDSARSHMTLGTESPFREHRSLGRIAYGYALAGEAHSAQELLAVQDSLAENNDYNTMGSGEFVLAVIALQEGRAEDAVQYLDRVKAAWYGQRFWTDRPLLAEAHAALGDFDEAIAQYDTLTGTYRLHEWDRFLSLPLRPLAHERLGSLYLEVGDTVSAARHLGEFIELWKDADPELQPRVQAARRLLAQLAAEETG